MDKYEKLYNEALERFKSFKEKYYTKDTNLGDVIFDKNGEMQKDFNGIFPELRESEDERIRKEIVSIVKQYGRICEKEGDPCCTINDCLAYLEKQKEPHYTKRNALFDKCVAECDPEIMQRVSDEIDEMLEKEQKPAKHNLTTWHRDVVYCAMCNKNLDEGLRCNLEIVYKIIKDIIDRTPVVKEQKPAEWNPNNEDVILFNKAVTTNPNLTPSERAKLDIIRMKFKHCNGHIATNDFDLALGERYIQGYNDGHNDAFGESKTAEWSEEDEYRREGVVEWLRDHQKTIDRNSNNQAYESIADAHSKRQRLFECLYG